VIDLHLLPGLDDGAQNLQTSLTMARAAVGAGRLRYGLHAAILPGTLLMTMRTEDWLFKDLASVQKHDASRTHSILG
jgi:hypothetical protein